MNNEKPDSYGKKYARTLYTELGRNIKETARELCEDEATIRSWIQEGEWDLVRQSNSISKQGMIRFLYRLSDQLKEKMSADETINPKDVDLLQKYASTIKTLDTENSVYSLIEAAELFITWLYQRNMSLAQTVTKQFDRFIKERKAA